MTVCSFTREAQGLVGTAKPLPFLQHIDFVICLHKFHFKFVDTTLSGMFNRPGLVVHGITYGGVFLSCDTRALAAAWPYVFFFFGNISKL